MTYVFIVLFPNNGFNDAKSEKMSIVYFFNALLRCVSSLMLAELHPQVCSVYPAEPL